MPNLWRSCLLPLACVSATAVPLISSAQTSGAIKDPASITLPAATLAAYTGRYQRDDAPDTVEAVYLKNGILTVDGERLFPQMLLAEAPDRFFQTGDSVRTVFQRDDAHQISGFHLVDMDGTTIVYTRLSSDATPLNRGLSYVRTEAMVPVRDGVKLHVVIVRPQGSTKGTPLPILLSRTPYGANGFSTIRSMPPSRSLQPAATFSFLPTFEDATSRKANSL